MNFNIHNKDGFRLTLNTLLLSSLLTLVLLMLVTRSLWAANMVLEFERQTLDLDTGTVLTDTRIDLNQEADFRIAYNATQTNHGALVWATAGVGFALLSGTTYANASFADTVGLSYNNVLTSLPDSSATVIVLTSTGAVYKMGNFVEGTTSVNFDTQLLQ